MDSKKTKALLLATGLLMASASHAAGTLIGQWDLNGDGKVESVYRNGANLDVQTANGPVTSYAIGNTVWAVFGAADTDGKPGAEVIIKAGPDLQVVRHASKTKKSYPMGNRVWSVIAAANVDNSEGNEVIMSVGTGIAHLNEKTGSVKEYTFDYNSTWSLVAAADLTGQGADVVLNMGNGIKVVNLRNNNNKDFTFPGYSAVVGVYETDGLAGGEILGRTSDKVYLIKGGVTGNVKYYEGSSTYQWAIYGNSVDTDGAAGNEIILAMQGFIRIIHPATNSVKDYQVGNTNYSIDSATDIDGVAGVELQVRDATGKIFILNDRLKKIYAL